LDHGLAFNIPKKWRARDLDSFPRQTKREKPVGAPFVLTVILTFGKSKTDIVSSVKAASGNAVAGSQEPA
jgi:hypothetical protein